MAVLGSVSSGLVGALIKPVGGVLTLIEQTGAGILESLESVESSLYDHDPLCTGAFVTCL